MTLPTTGSVLQIMPAMGDVRFRNGDDAWTCPLIGWAVVVTFVELNTDPVDDRYETAVEPLLISDETDHAEPVSEYLIGCRDGTRWAIALG